MAKKLTQLGDHVFFKKRLSQLALRPGICGFLKHKESVRFSGGIVGIRLHDGSLSVCSTFDDNVSFSLFYGPISSVSQYEKTDQCGIYIENPELENSWKQLFIYFFDEDGCFLFYADRDHLREFGPRISSCSANNSMALKAEALNVAAIFSTDLLDKISCIEKAIDSNYMEYALDLNGGV